MWQQSIASLGQVWGEQTGRFPMLTLQTVAIVGLVSTLFSARLGPGLPHRYAEARYGLTLGICALLLIALTAQIPGRAGWTSQLSVSGDILFLGGLLGGWLGGALCLACVVVAYAVFGDFSWTALLGTAGLALGGILLHRWFLRLPMAELHRGHLLRVWLAKQGVDLSAALALGLSAGKSFTADAVYLRLAYAPLSFLVLGSVLLLLRRQARERAHASTEPLTGLPNRRALGDYLDGLLAQSPHVPNTLITLELANLGDMVRMHGHDWSDHFWRQLVPVLRTHRLAQPLAVYQPHYFMFSDLALAIVLRHVAIEHVQRSGLADALFSNLADHLRGSPAGEMAPRLRMGVAMANLTTERGGKPTGSGASAQRPVANDGSYSHAAPILRNLNLALQSDARPIRYFHRSFAEKAELDEQLRVMLIGWISAASAPLQYQPKCRLRTGEIIGAEALLRAVDASGHDVPPAHVLELAARNHLLIELEWCTIETVVRAIDRGLRAGRPLPLAVNISAASVTVPGFGLRVLALLRETGTPCRMLAVEITETSPVPDLETVTESLLALHSAGVRLSLDDFGTGYSALSMLAKFPFNEVKIDYSMVARLDQPRMQAAVSLAYESAKRYSATLVAEGVETQWQVNTLLGLGITRGQGFFFSPAMALDDLLASERLSQFDQLPQEAAPAVM